MKRSQRQRARLLADYVDGLIAQRRSAGACHDAEQDDPELSELRELGAELSGIEVLAPDDFARDLGRRVARAGTASPPAHLLDRLRARLGRWQVPARHRFAATPSFRVAAATLAAVGVLMLYRSHARTVSAAEVLSKAQAALAQLVRPGEFMFRRWRIVDHIRDTPGGPERVEVRYLLEWMDGADNRAGAGRSLDVNGQVYLAYVNEPASGSASPRVYYKPGFSGEARGLLSIVPTREEFEAAATRLPGRLQPMIYQYLARGFVPYQPILGELRYNEAVIDAGRTAVASPVSPVNLSLETTSSVGGRPVYRLRFVDPLRVQFRWSSEGPPKAWLARYEIVRSIDVETFLNVQTESTEQHETGRLVFSTRELVETRIVKAPFTGEDPFDLTMPPGVITRRQSAYDHLTQVGRALERAPAFTAAIQNQSTETDGHR